MIDMDIHDEEYTLGYKTAHNVNMKNIKSKAMITQQSLKSMNNSGSGLNNQRMSTVKSVNQTEFALNNSSQGHNSFINITIQGNPDNHRYHTN